MAIHVAITRKILPGKEQEFKESLRSFLGQSFLHDGVHGAAIISSFPGADANEIGILRTFKDCPTVMQRNYTLKLTSKTIVFYFLGFLSFVFTGAFLTPDSTLVTSSPSSDSSIQTGAWSLDFFQPRTCLCTPPDLSRSARIGFNKK